MLEKYKQDKWWLFFNLSFYVYLRTTWKEFYTSKKLIKVFEVFLKDTFWSNLVLFFSQSYSYSNQSIGLFNIESSLYLMLFLLSRLNLICKIIKEVIKLSYFYSVQFLLKLFFRDFLFPLNLQRPFWPVEVTFEINLRRKFISFFILEVKLFFLSH